MADRALARKVLETEAAAILALVGRLDERFDRAVDLLLGCRGRVILTGMGKSGIICQKIAATLASTGTPAFFLHPAEAIARRPRRHSGRRRRRRAVVQRRDGRDPATCIDTIRRLGARLIAITGAMRSTLAQAADVALDCSVAEEACPLNLVPTASTTAALALGDALAMTLLDEKGFRQEDFASLHPGGKLGKRLMRVEALMHTGKAVPGRAGRDRHARRHLRDVEQGPWHDVRRRRRPRPARHHHGRRPAPAHGERRRHPRADGRRRDDARAGLDSAGHARGRGAQHHGSAGRSRRSSSWTASRGAWSASSTCTTCGAPNCSEPLDTCEP